MTYLQYNPVFCHLQALLYMEQPEQTVERMSQKAGGGLADGFTLSRHYAGVCLHIQYMFAHMYVYECVCILSKWSH